MSVRINHIAIISHQYGMLGKFYESLFGMKPAGDSPTHASPSYGDGNIGLQLLVRRDGYIGGLDHCGMLVSDQGEVEARMKANVAAMDPETMTKTWLPAGIQGFEQMQKMFWAQMNQGSDESGGDESGGKK